MREKEIDRLLRSINGNILFYFYFELNSNSFEIYLTRDGVLGKKYFIFLFLSIIGIRISIYNIYTGCNRKILGNYILGHNKQYFHHRCILEILFLFR